MNINDVTSILKMKDLYFSDINFKYKKDKMGQFTLNISHNVEYLQNSKNENLIKVIITTTIQDEIDQLSLNVVCNGIFELAEDHELNDTEKQQLLKNNTVAIMFPYIRSQISIITSQPGLTPIQIPLVDVNKILNNYY